MTDSNWPAIDDVAVSSTTEELRATRACWSPPARSKASRTAGCVGHVGPGVDRVGERGGEHDTGEASRGRRCRPRQRRRLAAGEGGVERGGVVEGDDERAFGVGVPWSSAQVPFTHGEHLSYSVHPFARQ